MKYATVTAEVWRTTRKLEAWEDESTYTDDDLEAIQLRASVNCDKVKYVMDSHRPNRCLLVMDDGDSLVLVGDVDTATYEIFS